jgi:hypothetical protein
MYMCQVQREMTHEQCMTLARYRMEQQDQADLDRRRAIIAQGIANAGAPWSNQPKPYVLCNHNQFYTTCF